MSPPNSKLRGSIEISLASFGFGFLGVFGKWAFSSGLNVGEVLTYRFGFAAIIIWLLLLIFKPEWVRLSLRQILIAGLLGTFGYAFFATLYFEAIDGLSITLAALLLYTYPFWVNVFSHLFTKDRISILEASCLLSASIGLVLLLWGNIEVKKFVAILSGLGSAISYAIYVMLSGKLQRNVKPITSTIYVISFATLALALFHQPPILKAFELNQQAYLSVLGLAIICTILPLTLELAALQKISSKQVALLMMIEPITASFLGALLFNESLSLRQYFGAAIIITSLIINTSSNLNSKGL